MILYFRRKEYCWGDTFYVYDENNQRKYRVDSGIVLWNRKFEIRDMNKKVLVTIKNEPKSLLKKKFYVKANGQEGVAVTREISIVPKYIIEGVDWQLRGVMQHEYELLSDGQEVLSMHVEQTRWGEYAVLRISDSVDELLALGVAMTISYVLHAGEDGNHTHYA